MPTKIIVAFDAYGTLLSTESVAKKLAEHFGEGKAQVLAQSWRKYQLEYTWRLNSMGQYKDFSYVTRQSLKNSLAEESLSLSDSDIDALMKSYDSLTIFPDVAKTLEKLRSTPDIHPVVFSNGTHSMVSASVTKSPDLKEYTDVFKDIVVVEEVQKFKPAPEVYRHLAKKVGKDPESKEDMGNIWLVSGNPFDVTGARAMGWNVIWVDRARKGWVDGLVEGEKGRPTEIVKNLETVVTTIASTNSEELTGQWREMHGARET